jgi:hypothetical protein
VQKREDIISNFEGHITQIRQQMDEEKVALRVKNDLPGQTETEPEYFINEIERENRMLEQKFADLNKEIIEKSVLMDQ